jgi:hypothetical protein
VWGGGPNDVRSRSAFSIQLTKVFKYCSVDLLHFQAIEFACEVFEF